MGFLTFITLLVNLSMMSDPDIGAAGSIAGFFMMTGCLYGIYFLIKLIYCFIKKEKKLKTFIAAIACFIIAFYSTIVMLNYVSPEKMKEKADREAARTITTETISK